MEGVSAACQLVWMEHAALSDVQSAILCRQHRGAYSYLREDVKFAILNVSYPLPNTHMRHFYPPSPVRLVTFYGGVLELQLL